MPQRHICTEIGLPPRAGLAKRTSGPRRVLMAAETSAGLTQSLKAGLCRPPRSRRGPLRSRPGPASCSLTPSSSSHLRTLARGKGFSHLPLASLHSASASNRGGGPSQGASVSPWDCELHERKDALAPVGCCTARSRRSARLCVLAAGPRPPPASERGVSLTMCPLSRPLTSPFTQQDSNCRDRRLKGGSWAHRPPQGPHP